MKVFVGNINVWQRAKLLTALYDNLALSAKFSPLSYDTARDLLAERNNNIRHVGNFFIGVDFAAKDGNIDLTKYNETLLKNERGTALRGEKVVEAFRVENGLASIKPEGQSLLNACDPTFKPFKILSLPKPKVVQASTQAVDTTVEPKGCGVGVGC